MKISFAYSIIHIFVTKLSITFISCLEQMLAFVGDAEKFKKFKERYCNARRDKRSKTSQKENKAPVAKKIITK